MALGVGLKTSLLMQLRVARPQRHRQRQLSCACCDVRIAAFQSLMSSKWEFVEKWWGTHHKRIPGIQIGKSVWRVRMALKGNEVRACLYALSIVSEPIVFVQANNGPIVIGTMHLW